MQKVYPTSGLLQHTSFCWGTPESFSTPWAEKKRGIFRQETGNCRTRTTRDQFLQVQATAMLLNSTQKASRPCMVTGEESSDQPSWCPCHPGDSAQTARWRCSRRCWTRRGCSSPGGRTCGAPARWCAGSRRRTAWASTAACWRYPGSPAWCRRTSASDPPWCPLVARWWTWWRSVGMQKQSES